MRSGWSAQSTWARSRQLFPNPVNLRVGCDADFSAAISLRTPLAARERKDASRHILRRRLRLLAPEDHRRFIELEARDVVELLRCTRDVYREFAEENQCAPLSEAYWVILRFAILPTSIGVIQQKVVDYLKMTQVAGVDLSLLFGIETQACSRLRLDGSGGKCDLSDRTPASDTELQTLSEYVNEGTLFCLEEDGVWVPRGGGPFAVDDDSSILWSWGLLFALNAGATYTDWLPVRERLWRRCAPWTEGLTTLFRCTQDELRSQWQALSPDSQARELSWKQRPSEFEKVLVSTPGDRYEKEGETWAIAFAGETCRLAAPLIGLDYILILLQNPGRPMRALELQTVLAGNPIASRPASKLVVDDVTVDARTDTDEDECSLSSPGHSSRDEQLDPKAIRQYKERLKDLERDATNAYNLGDNEKGDELQKQYDEIESRLKQSFDIHHRPRVFSGENEKARMSITRALKRAYDKIRVQAPKTAEHMESYIKTGSEFVYLDNSISWKL